MTRRLLSLTVAGLISASLIGCGIDTAVIISHPTKVKPSTTMSVVFADMLTILSNGSTLNFQSVVKDSLHVAAGLPAGWTISGLSYYVATGLKLTKLVGTSVDTQALLALAADSMQTYISRSTAMHSDPGNQSFFVGKEIKATNQQGDSLLVNTDSISQWLVYGNPISLSFPVGTPMDTTIAFPDSLKNALGVTIPSQIPLDSLGVKVVPIFIMATITVGAANGDFNLYYFTRTGKIPSTASDTSGSMVFATVNVNPSNAVRNPRLATTSDNQFNVFPNPFRASDIVTFNSRSPMNLGIFTAQGALVHSLSTNGNVPVVWNATANSGTKLAPGTYFVRSQNGATAAKTISLLR